MAKNESDDAVSSPDRRTSDRKKLIVDVRFDGGDGTGIANTRDIGVGGLYMTTTTVLDIGTSIVMSLNAGQREMTIKGVVVYSDPGHGVGVRFQDVSEDDLKALTDGLELG